MMREVFSVVECHRYVGDSDFDGDVWGLICILVIVRTMMIEVRVDL